MISVQPEEKNETRWIRCLDGEPTFSSDTPVECIVGAIDGEGIGKEVVGAALQVLRAVSEVSDSWELVVKAGGNIGRDGERECGKVLPPDTIEFCESIFVEGGAILCGPGGGRFVYDLRKEFDLFFKISPIQVENGLIDSARIKTEFLKSVDILVVRENCGGVYQGTWSEVLETNPEKEGVCQHTFSYSESEVKRFLKPAARLAASRSGLLTVACKESGVPGISQLWKDCANEISAGEGVEIKVVDIDLMAYRLIQDAAAFDVIAAPNLFGDILADLGAVLLGSRGVSYSGNFDGRNRAVYQTNHGAAYDLAGKNEANPVGQILSAAMMLRESFGLAREAQAIQEAVREVWKKGVRTRDVMGDAVRPVSTSELAEAVVEEVTAILEKGRSSTGASGQ